MLSSNSEHSRGIFAVLLLVVVIVVVGCFVDKQSLILPPPEWAVKGITSLVLHSPPDSRKGVYDELQRALGSKKSAQVHTRVALFNILENFLKVVEGKGEGAEEVKAGLGGVMVGGLVGFVEKDPASEDLKLRAMEVWIFLNFCLILFLSLTFPF